MVKRFVTLLFPMVFLLFISQEKANAQKIQSPENFLGYAMGQNFAWHADALSYFKYLSSVSGACKVLQYGVSTEGRPLFVLFVSAEKNIQNLEEIRLNHLKHIHPAEGKNSASDKIIIWNSFNVHGNEAAGMETALWLAWELVSENSKFTNLLDSMVIVIDPCLNPDGRDAYVSYQRRWAGNTPITDPQDMEHLRNWPGERYNHYFFDLNRDWIWATQTETQHRLKLFNSWLPHVHADFHEMSNQYSYFFAPAAKPIHKAITPWQYEFQMHINNDNARVFNQNSWPYFSREIYDMFYPGFGDSYPSFRGSIGLTFEKGGIDGGLRLEKNSTDTLTFTERIEQHLVSARNVLYTSYAFREKMKAEQQAYFNYAAKTQHKSYIIKTAHNLYLQQNLANLLNRHQIQYQMVSATKQLNGWSYKTGKSANIIVQAGDMYVTTRQTNSTLTQILFEANPFLEDSLTYDLTSWALPYAVGADAFELNDEPAGLKLKPFQSDEYILEEIPDDALGVVLPWDNLNNAATVFQLLALNYNLKRLSKPMKVAGKMYPAGSVVCVKGENFIHQKQFATDLFEVCKQNNTMYKIILNKNVTDGVELGSTELLPIAKPNVAVLGGNGIQPTAFADVWYFFDQTLKFPVSRLRTDLLENSDLMKYTYIIVPAGELPDVVAESLRRYARNGGKLVLLENAMGKLIGRGFAGIQINEWNLDSLSQQLPYSLHKRLNLTTRALGAVFVMQPDTTNPLFWGISNLYILKRNNLQVSIKQDYTTCEYLNAQNYRSGFIGSEFRKQAHKQVQFLVKDVESGKLIYFADSPFFRAFWLSDGLVFANALLL